MKRSQLSYGVAFAAIVTPAFADDLNITDTTTSPVTTASAANGTPGNINIQADLGFISVKTSGAVVTLNSNNSVDNAGVGIQTTAKNDAIGVHILGGFTGSYTQELSGAVNVVGTGTGNYGVLLDGSAPFNGDITFKDTTLIGIHGENSIGVDIKAPLNGNLTVTGISGFGVGTTGVLVTAPISGAFAATGTIFPLATLTTQDLTKVDPLTGPGIAVGASIGGGFLVSGAVDVRWAPSFAVGVAPSIAGTGATDITIGPYLTDATNPTYSVINRGTIDHLENDPGMSTTALRIGEHTAGAAAHSTTLTGGIINAGVIQAESRSDNFYATRAAATPTNATGLEIGNGAIVKSLSYSQPAGSGSTTSTIVLDAGASTTTDFYNGLIVRWNGQDRVITAYDGTTKTATIGALNGSSATWTAAPGAADAFTIRSAALENTGKILACQPQCLPATSTYVPGVQTGTVTALLIQPFGSLPSLSNAGTINSQVTTSDTSITSWASYAIRDLSGTLTDITNSATISATVLGGTALDYSPTLGNRSLKAVAIDLSAGSSNQTILNVGRITGDIFFGTAGMNGAVAGNQLTIEGTLANVSGNVHATGAGTLDIHVSSQGTGGLLLTADTRANTLAVGSAGSVGFALNSTSLASSVVSTSGNVSFDSGSGSAIVPRAFLANGTYTLLSAGGNLHIADTTKYDLTDSTNAAGFGVPFLYHGSLATDSSATVLNDGKTLKLTLARKTAAEAGLTGNAAIVYEPAAAAAFNDDDFALALLSLSSSSQVQSALESAVPDIAGGVRALAVAMTDQATGVIGSRQRALLTSPEGTRNEFRFWGQEFYNNVRNDSTASAPGYGGAGQGVAVGGEWGALNTGRYGVGLTFFSSQETETHPRDTKTDGDWGVISAYSAWRYQNVFLAPQLNVGFGDMSSRRGIAIGSLVRSASAKWQSYVAAGGLTTGYIVDFGPFQIIPTLALDGMYLRESSYSESGAGAVGLSLKAQSQQSTRAFAGVIGQGNFSYDEGNLMPQVIAGWSHEFLNDPATIDATFEAAPGSPVHLVGPTVEPNHIVGGMSLGYVLRNWSAGVNYDASANSGSLAQSATFSISSRF